MSQHPVSTYLKSPLRWWYSHTRRISQRPPKPGGQGVREQFKSRPKNQLSENRNNIQVIGKKGKKIQITINGTPLKQVENLIYLGGTISPKGSCTEDIQYRIGKALGAVQRLQPIWKADGIQQDTKVELYRALVLSILLYGAETWTLRKENERRLLVFEMMCLRKIMGVSRLENVRYIDQPDTGPWIHYYRQNL